MLWVKYPGVPSARWQRRHVELHNNGELAIYTDALRGTQVDLIRLRSYALEIVPSGTPLETHAHAAGGKGRRRAARKKDVLDLHAGEQIVQSDHVFELVEGELIVLCSGTRVLALTTPEGGESGDWLISLRLVLGALYQITPVISQAKVSVQLADGQLFCMPISAATHAENLITALCRQHACPTRTSMRCMR